MYIVQVIDNNVVYPVVVGTTIDMHPLWVLLTVLAGGWYGGILWMLISVPMVFLVYQLVMVLYTNLKEFRII
jgi:predicted PurR-regulated permease PerM